MASGIGLGQRPFFRKMGETIHSAVSNNSLYVRGADQFFSLFSSVDRTFKERLGSVFQKNPQSLWKRVAFANPSLEGLSLKKTATLAASVALASFPIAYVATNLSMNKEMLQNFDYQPFQEFLCSLNASSLISDPLGTCQVVNSVFDETLKRVASFEGLSKSFLNISYFIPDSLGICPVNTSQVLSERMDLSMYDGLNKVIEGVSLFSSQVAVGLATHSLVPWIGSCRFISIVVSRFFHLGSGG